MSLNSFLLDTHALMWFQENNPKLPTEILSVIQDPNNVILFSQISLFEIAIKQTIGKLPQFTASPKEIYDQAINDGFTFVEIHNTHIYQYSQIELMEQHRDPFDRLIIATAVEHGAVILSNDDKFKFYSDTVKVLWS